MMTPPPLPSSEHQRLLFEVAFEAIRRGLAGGASWKVDPNDYPPELRQPSALFVTLMSRGELRGCVGTLTSREPLVVNVAYYAHAAAFGDSRFDRLAKSELAGLEVHLSLLSELEPMACQSEAELLAQLQPGRDGLLLEDGVYRATFLPSVWIELPNPAEFVRQLKRKAGMAPAYWSATLRCQRYVATSLRREQCDYECGTK